MFLKKVFLFLKSYWYVPVSLLIAIAFYLRTKDKTKLADFSDFFEKTRKSHKDEIKVIEKLQKDKDDAIAKATKRVIEVRKQIEEEYKKSGVELDAKKIKRIEEITKKLKNDPNAMADEIEKETGYKVVVIE